MEKIIGVVSSCDSIIGSLKDGIVLDGSVNVSQINSFLDNNEIDIFGTISDSVSISGQVNYPTVVVTQEYPDYQGRYTIVPERSDVVLPTKETVLRDDITVKPTPSFRVNNEYGTTFTIGG